MKEPDVQTHQSELMCIYCTVFAVCAVLVQSTDMKVSWLRCAAAERWMILTSEVPSV